jgi:hypothetical protein
MGFSGHKVTELSFDNTNLTFGAFKAIDYFGDASFYLLNTPGVSGYSIYEEALLNDLAPPGPYDGTRAGYSYFLHLTQRRFLPQSWTITSPAPLSAPLSVSCTSAASDQIIHLN